MDYIGNLLVCGVNIVLFESGVHHIHRQYTNLLGDITLNIILLCHGLGNINGWLGFILDASSTVKRYFGPVLQNIKGNVLVVPYKNDNFVLFLYHLLNFN